VGWRQLHNDVSMFVARHLIAILQELQTIDTPVQEDLYRLRRELERNCDAGTPWLSQDALEPLAIVDMPAWASLCGLLSECPVLPAALTAILENRGSAHAAAPVVWGWHGGRCARNQWGTRSGGKFPARRGRG